MFCHKLNPHSAMRLTLPRWQSDVHEDDDAGMGPQKRRLHTRNKTKKRAETPGNLGNRRQSRGDASKVSHISWLPLLLKCVKLTCDVVDGSFFVC